MKIAIKASPGAKKTEILGWEEDYPHIGRVLRVRIGAPAVDNKANKELITSLAKMLGVAKGQIELCHGSSGRIKLLELPDSAWEKLCEITRA